MLRVVWSSYRWATCDENDDEEKKTEGGASYCMNTNILAASLSDRTVRLIDGNTGTYLSIMDFEFISTQSSFSLLGLEADERVVYDDNKLLNTMCHLIVLTPVFSDCIPYYTFCVKLIILRKEVTTGENNFKSLEIIWS